MKIRNRKKNSAFTLAEVMIASALSTMVLGMVFSLFYLTAKEQREGYIEQRLRAHADRVEEYVTNTIREKSVTSGLFFSNPIGPYFRIVTFRKGIYDKIEMFSYNPGTKNLYHDPNNAASNDEIIVGFPENAQSSTHLDEVKFWKLLDNSSGNQASTAIGVYVEVSDHGKTNNAPTDKTLWKKEVRTFIVALRCETE